MFGPPFESQVDRDVREQDAKQICAGCAVIDECRGFALATRQIDGVWGGLGEIELRRPYRRRTVRMRFSTEALAEIEARLAAGESQASIAGRFGVSQPQISDVARGDGP